MKALRKIFKNFVIVLLLLMLTTNFLITSLFLPATAYAASSNSNLCAASAGLTSPIKARHTARVGGVALDMAAKFLANMNDITGAYYDSTLDRIVFVGKTNTTLPQFNKDDMAVAIKSVIYNKTVPAVSMEFGTPNDNKMDVIMYGGIEDTQFGKTLLDADWKLKQYIHGYDENNNKITSSVSSYQSHFDRWLGKSINPTSLNTTRWWITPKEMTIGKDDAASAFVFQTATMQVKTEAQNPNNDPAWNQAAQEFADNMTVNYDGYAQETPAWNQAKQLGKIVSVIKWLADNHIQSDFNWARDYAPKIVPTDRQKPQLTTPIVQGHSLTGGLDYNTANTYNPDSSGTSSSLKTSSQTVPTTKQDIHWTFSNNGQTYDAVAVEADAFRSLGSYNTAVSDMSFPTAGDLTLAFQRAYSSFSGGQYGAGRGWNIFPARLTDNKPTENRLVCGSATHPKGLGFMSQGGIFESYTINDCNVGYVPDDPAYHSKVFHNTDGTFTARTKDQTEYSFDASYKFTKQKDKNGNTISYNYDGSGKLTSVADSKGHQITVNYGSNNLISSISDWSGRSVNYTYDDQGELLTVKDPNNNITTYTYDSNFKLTSVTDRNSQLVTTNTYTDGAKLATQKDAANITNTYSYDNTNKAITITDNQTPSRTQKTTFDIKARILQQTDPLLYNIIYTYGTEYAPLTIKDKNGNIITNVYDTNGNLTSITYPDTKKVTYQYDVNNRITKSTDERYGVPGKDTTYTYDGIGNLTQVNEASQTKNYTYDSSGEALTLTDPLSHIITWTRDSFGNKLTEKDALNKITNLEYDTIGRLKKKTDPDTKIFSYTYDNNSNQLTQTDAVGTTTNIYDKENRLTKVTLPDNTVNEFTYNSSGTLTSTKDSALNTSSYGYDSYQNLTSQTDALNKITNNSYDALNRQTQSTTPLGKLYKYEYDGNGNITKRTDANNIATTYQYDAFNHLAKITYPNSTIVTFTYDNRGNRTQMIDPVGTSTYTYDSFDRLTQATNAYGKILQYTYDNANNLKTITYPDNGAVTYTYDNNNRLSSVKDWSNKTTTYTYNNNGIVATRLLPNNIKTTYAYDAANRPTTITHANGATTVAKYDYTRDLVGNIKIATESGTFIGTSQTTKYDYDALGRIIKATYPNNTTPYIYTYDKAGNRLTSSFNDTSNGNVSIAYAYDDDYKITQKNVTDYALHAYNSFTYDNNGNQTKKPSQNANPDPIFSFDFENRLIAHTTAAGNAYDYKYDGLGNRLRKHMSTAVTRYIYDTSGPISRLMATSGDQNYASTFWIYGQGLIYDTDNHYYLEDGLGSARYISSSSGGKSGSVSYDPFGNIRSFSSIADFQFQKELLDNESGMYFLRARYYDPADGRFISRDPISGSLRQPQSLNPYAYALNNTNSFSDPSGLSADGACVTATIGVGVYGSCSICKMKTSSGQNGTTISFSVGGMAGIAAGIAPNYTHDYKANKLSELSGLQVQQGGSLTIPGLLNLSGEISNPPNNKPNASVPITGYTTGVSEPGAKVSGEYHGGPAWTYVLWPSQ